jgi:hypothetical protein
MGTVAATRRQVLTGAVAAATVAPAPPDWLGALAARVEALGGPGLLRSYDVSRETPFDRTHAQCAYVYDNAAAGLALLAGGRPDLARRLGDALVQAQGNDRYWHDGRFRNAYRAGPAPASGAYPMPGWWDAAQSRWVEDAYQAGTAAGVVAWAMLLLLALQNATGIARYGEAAGKAGDWVGRTAKVSRGYAGGFLGFEPGPQAVGWVSTEHNIDLAVAFAQLGRASDASHARDFVASMWEAKEGRFLAGLRPDGTPNPTAAVDANIWPSLTSFAEPAWQRALDWTLAHQGVPPAAPEGVSFSSAQDGIWLEGTAYVALAAKRAKRTDLAARMLATLRAQTAPGGLVWACSVARLTTGFSTGLTDTADFFYYRRPHVGATAWAAMARAGADPFSLGEPARSAGAK